jgi:regulator of sirC expression with transglutaminase-like and TPR domain
VSDERNERLSLFSSLVHGPDQQIPLCRAALLFAADGDPKLKIDNTLEAIRNLGDEIGASIPVLGEAPPSVILEEFLRVFHGEHRFQGEHDNYDAPENSFLNRVLERRRGLPITLSVLAVELLRHIGLEAYGVGLPGRYIARCETEQGPVWFDPFSPGPGRGTLLDETDCVQLALSHGTVVPPGLLNQTLAPARHHGTLVRMLNNLLGAYSRRSQHLQKCRTLDWLLILHPGDMELTLARGQAYYAASMPGLAMRDLERYLHHAPNGPQAPPVQALLTKLRRDYSQN